MPPYSRRVSINAPIVKFPFLFRNAAGQDDINLVKGAMEPIIMPLDFNEPYSVQWAFSLEQQIGDHVASLGFFKRLLRKEAMKL